MDDLFLKRMSKNAESRRHSNLDTKIPKNIRQTSRPTFPRNNISFLHSQRQFERNRIHLHLFTGFLRNISFLHFYPSFPLPILTFCLSFHTFTSVQKPFHKIRLFHIISDNSHLSHTQKPYIHKI